VPAAEEVVVRSDRGEVVVRRWEPEPWAAAAGRDRFGPWADADIKGVILRFRWIPSGRFVMGSPESEAGRYDNEGPQHEVTWAKGMWLADTPVTQALWQAVMGKNPSYFKSPTRPVESVSWDDCQEFMRAIEKVAPGLLARLPGEAEWEYACRGGTETATWLGDLEILGENNAPVLDEIAWYGGNSGQVFELANGYDSKDWPNKQYPHTKAGSHPVRGKDPNPLGLHDMLGNVWEWCEDMYQPYGAERNAPATAGPNRVIRGGAWDSYVRDVRAALRDASAPDLRGRDLGLRLARGQPPSQGAEPQVRGGRSHPSSASGAAVAPFPEKRRPR
jgi:formylglycine-generating enzyme required for sulfatase activity